MLLFPKDTGTVPTVELSHHTEESYYAIARFIMKGVQWFLNLIGQSDNATLFTWVYAILVFLIALLIGSCVKWVVLVTTRGIARKFDTTVYRGLREHSFFLKACRIITPIVFIVLIQFTLFTRQSLALWLTRISWIYVVFVIASALNTLLTVIWEHINEKENTRKLPLKGLLQLVKGVVWIVAIIFVLGILLSKTPASLLAGLGAFSAVLMLVFKDNILGVVAGVQLSENDSLHVGDWIKVKGTDANGSVMEVTLTSVKVQNWDKTITTLPPYSLISNGFTNYRNMQESHSRRIQRSYMIDADSVLPADDAMLAKFAELPFMKEWIEKKIEQRNAGKVEDANNSAGLVDGSIDTNLGVFRAYMKMWLDAHPRVDHSGGISFCFVTTLAQTSGGIPLQVYCFTNTSAWLDYEAIQASIFEHLAAMLYKFHLYTFENPTGRDTVLDGYLSPGKNPDVLFGLPYPYFNASGSPENPGKPVQRSAYPEVSAMQPSAPDAPSPQPSAPAQTGDAPANGNAAK